jgi:hypothetical protein
MLHPLTRLKDNVVTAIKNARDAFNDPSNKVVQQKLQEAFPGDPQTQEQVRQKIAANLNEAFASASTDKRDQRWFTPRNPMAGLAQSAMNVRALKGAAPSATGSGGAGAAPALAPLQQFGPVDPEWIECVIDGFKTLLNGKAPFVQHQNLSDFLQNIDDRGVIALVGDWGAHNNAAKKVAQQIRDAKAGYRDPSGRHLLRRTKQRSHGSFRYLAFGGSGHQGYSAGNQFRPERQSRNVLRRRCVFRRSLQSP